MEKEQSGEVPQWTKDLLVLSLNFAYWELGFDPQNHMILWHLPRAISKHKIGVIPEFYQVRPTNGEANKQTNKNKKKNIDIDYMVTSKY